MAKALTHLLYELGTCIGDVEAMRTALEKLYPKGVFELPHPTAHTPCRTPSSLAAPLKLKWSATHSAQLIDIGLTAAASVIPLGVDLFRGMTTLLT
jgi:hypothetical protein